MLTFLTPASAADWYYPGDGATLQGVEDRAASGDVIHVAAGAYTENLAVDLDVTFELDPGATITAGHPDDGVFKVVSGASVTVSGGALSGAWGSGA